MRSLADLPWRLIAAGALVGLLIAAWSAVDPFRLFEVAELKALNGQFNLRGPVAPRSPIVIVTVDEDSFDELDLQWPWPRALHGKFLDIVGQGKPAAIGLDIIFSEPSSRGDADDQALAESVARARVVVLGAALTVVREAGFVKEDLNAPRRPIRDGAAGFGFVNFDTDADAFVRRAALTRPFQGSELAGFDLLIYKLAVKAGVPAKPLPRRPEILINFRGGPRSFPTVPFHRVVNGEVPPAEFAGKIVLVGATTQILHDVFPTPFAPEGTMPGIEIHANALETVLQGVRVKQAPFVSMTPLAMLRRLPVGPLPDWLQRLVAYLGSFELIVGVSNAVAVPAGILAVMVAGRLHPVLAFTVVGSSAFLYLAACHGTFVFGRYWVGAVPVPVALGVGYFGTVVRNFLREQREKRRLSRFFSPDVIKEIVRHKDDATLDSGRRRMTVLFSDIRGFTSISERISAEDTVTFLREYLTEMTDAVFKHGGTIDKYMGDGIMALYNVPFEAPDHAAQAVRTALEFQERLVPLAARFADKHTGSLRCGVGINTGEAVVGTIGSAQRLEYTAIGDAINLGSRLESATKDYNVPIILSEETYQEVKGLFATRYLGEVTVKGKEIPVKIYTVLGPASAATATDAAAASSADTEEASLATAP